MGAWGSGHFQNDDARDLVGELVDAADWAVVDGAFERVLEIGDDDYLEAPESSTAIAGAAIIAGRLGKLANDINPQDQAVVQKLKPPAAALVAKARKALARIRKQSELADLWEEAGAKDEWLATVTEVEQAL